MKEWSKSELEISQEIMNTDVYVQILSDTRDQAEMNQDLAEAIDLFRNFERRMSRFRAESELSSLNASEEMVVSKDLFVILRQCRDYFIETEGIFDPAILPVLSREGYEKRVGDRGNKTQPKKMYSYKDVLLDDVTLCVRKPLDLQIDLGGIGKGYIVDRVVERLSQKYEHLFVYAGGDIRVAGKDRFNGYDYWTSDIEDPSRMGESIATLLLRDTSVATSGTNRRRWQKAGQKKHHLIDPRVAKSAETDLLSVTVVADCTERVDVWAKVFCILGSEQGMDWAKEKGISALFVKQTGDVVYTKDIKQYLWQE